VLPGGPGVRIDTHIYDGYTVPPYYDSLIAKVIVNGRNRQESIIRMRRALKEFRISGIKTTIPIQTKILQHDVFQKGDYYTNFIVKHIYGV
jgi:acetyl-CoA carboxylase biotin carboxylase subunit